jgi:hypothetical protein
MMHGSVYVCEREREREILEREGHISLAKAVKNLNVHIPHSSS